MAHPSRYGPDYVVSSKSMTEGGDQCVHVARVTDSLRARVESELMIILRDDTEIIVRDESDGLAEYTGSEFAKFLESAKAGEFDHLLSATVPA